MMAELINIKSGEILDMDCPDEFLSDAYKEVRLKQKQLEDIAEALKNAILDRVKPGDKDFCKYWVIETRKSSINESEDVKMLSIKDKKEFNKAKKKFNEYKSRLFEPVLAQKKYTTIIKFPRM